MKPTITPLVLSTATFGLMLGVAQNAQAALIPGISVSSTLGVDPSIPWNINNTVNGRGLLGNTPSLTGNHVTSTDVSTAWRSVVLTNAPGSTIPGASITFNLNGTYLVSGFTFWNFGGTSAALTRQGIRNVTVEYFDGTNWLAAPGAPTTFTQGLFNTAPTPPADQTAQPYSFTTPVTTNLIRFTNLSNFGNLAATNNQIGFNEVQFDGTVPPPPPTQIPEPSSLLALLAVGLGGVSLRKRI